MLFFKKKPKKIEYKQLQGCKINPTIEDILKSPHCLIAGTTGSGKSVFLNNIICSFLANNMPDNKILLIDPKRVELSQYKAVPHCIGYTSEVDQAIIYLDEMLAEIESRYKYMEENHLREYNGPHIYIIIDELADIMISPQKKAFQLKLQKILQIARAAHIHVIACTQAPNRVTIPSSIVLNFTNRIALRCISSIESRQIINISGAEKLPQYGKAFYLSPKTGITSIDIPFIHQYTIDRCVDAWLYTMVKKA